MRKGLALLVALVMAAQPAMAQGKTKVSVADEAIAALELCEAFARGDVLATDEALAAGWDASEQDGESVFIRSYEASRDMPGLGLGDVFVLVEDYPDRTLGYCRLDAVYADVKARTAVEAIAGLDRYAGETRTDAAGTYASLKGSGSEDSLLMTHWDDLGFVIQLTILTPKAESQK